MSSAARQGDDRGNEPANDEGVAAGAVAGLSRAYRIWAKAHPGRYAAFLRAHDSDDMEQAEVTRSGLEIIFAALSNYGLKGDDEINAVRLLRANLHGFVALELAGGFGFPNDVDHSFELLVGALDQTLRTWPPRAATPAS